MSVERSFEAWEEVQRHGQDLADRLAQGFTGLIQSHMKPFDFEFPSKNFGKREFGFVNSSSGVHGVSAIFDIGNRIGQAGADLGASLNGVVQQAFRRLPLPFRQDETRVTMGAATVRGVGRQVVDAGVAVKGDLVNLPDRLKGLGCRENEAETDETVDEDVAGLNPRTGGHFGRPRGTVSVTSTYSSRTNEVESSLVARGDLWRLEASHGGSTASNDNSSLFLLQLGPVLFVRDSTLLLPVHLSKQHLLWYGYDRKHGMHSLCPAVWSKHRRWLLMSMLCLNPPACSFVDLQFPNGQVTYISGEGITTSAFVPFFGGLLQVQGQYPGEMRFSFSCKNKWGTCITPIVQWPDKSFTLDLAQDLAWQKSGLLVKPTVQFSVCPTFWGSNPGLRAELIHSVREQLNLICGYALTAQPSVFASISIGRSKWNGNVGNSGIVLRVDAPLSSVARPSFSVQINSGLEF